MQHPSVTRTHGEVVTEYTFVESDSLPEDIPVSTPFTFPFVGSDVVLELDKQDWWNPPGGKLEPGESWEQAVKRETREEVGVEIDQLAVIGYVLAKSSGDLSQAKFPAVTMLPFTISFVTKIDSGWTPRETKARKIFTQSEATKVLSVRPDAQQMQRIFEYANVWWQKNYTAKFTYRPGVLDDAIPTTSSMMFCRNAAGQYCVVREFNSSVWSLPGGACNLLEEPLACAKRELYEETQMTSKNERLLGSVLVEMIDRSGQVVSQMQQARYVGEVETQAEFTPGYNGFEVEEMDFVPLTELQAKVKQLQYDAGSQMIAQLSEAN